MTISTEQFLSVLVGASENDGTGDPLRNAFIKLNSNFSSISDIGFDAGNINVRGSIEIQNINDAVLTLPNYTVASAPDPATVPEGSIIFVNNGNSGNAGVAVSINDTWYNLDIGSPISSGT